MSCKIKLLLAHRVRSSMVGGERRQDTGLARLRHMQPVSGRNILPETVRLLHDACPEELTKENSMGRHVQQQPPLQGNNWIILSQERGIVRKAWTALERNHGALRSHAKQAYEIRHSAAKQPSQLVTTGIIGPSDPASLE